MALDTMVEAKRRTSISSPARSDDLDCTSSSADSSRVDDSTTPPPQRNSSFPGAVENLRAPPVIPAVVGAPFSRHSLKFSIEKILSPEFGKTPKHGSPIAAEVRRTHNGLIHNHLHHAAVPPLSRTVPTSPTDFFSAVTGPPTPASNNNREHHRNHHRRVQQPESPSSNCSSVNSSVRPRSVGASTPETSQSPKLPSLAPQEDGETGKKGPILWPAWVYCTRYSDRPSSGPRSRRMKKKEKKPDEKRPRTAFTAEQLARLKQEFQENRYLTEKRRQDLAKDLKLNESQIKIWFQNKRAKIKKASGQRNPLALQLMAQGLYNHSTVAMDGEGEDDSMDKS